MEHICGTYLAAFLVASSSKVPDCNQLNTKPHEKHKRTYLKLMHPLKSDRVIWRKRGMETEVEKERERREEKQNLESAEKDEPADLYTEAKRRSLVLPDCGDRWTPK